MVSLRKAIDEHCKGCIYDPLSGLGGWREQVTLCTVTTCPLYPVRPIHKSKSQGNAGKQPKQLLAYQERRKAEKESESQG